MVHFKPRNLAKVTLSGTTIYLGRWGSPEASEQYDQVVKAWLDGGRRWPHDPDSCATDAESETEPPAAVVNLCTRYTRHILDTYGEGTTHRHTKWSLELLIRSNKASCTPAEFGPRRLTDFQAWLAANPYGSWSRKTVNEYTDIVVRMFRWAVQREWATAEQHAALALVPSLRRGRKVPGAPLDLPGLRESRKITPPAAGAVEAVLPFLPPVVRDMVLVQRLSGMRPREVCWIRSIDLRPTAVKTVYEYAVLDGANKTAWKDIDRIVHIGPRAMAILKPYLDRRPEDAPLFSPRESEELRGKARRASRATPLYPSHENAVRAKRRRKRGAAAIEIQDFYAPDAYGKAVRRACEACNRKRVKDGLKPIERWFPYQLRHEAATSITEKLELEVARDVLGHASIETTLGYVTVRKNRAAKAAQKLG